MKKKSLFWETPLRQRACTSGDQNPGPDFHLKYKLIPSLQLGQLHSPPPAFALFE